MRELVLLILPQTPLGPTIAILPPGLSMGLLGSPFDSDLLDHIPSRHCPQPELGLVMGWTGSVRIAV